MYIARCSLKYMLLRFFPYVCMDRRYGGYQRFDAIEKAHLLACKRLLSVGLQTPNAMVLGDLG